VAETGSFLFDTPVSRIRAAAGRSGVGALTLTALALVIADDLQAYSLIPNLPEGTLDDDLLTWRDFAFSPYEIETPDGRVIVVDDPSLSVLIRATASGFIVENIVNSPARMAELLDASRIAMATFLAAQGTFTPQQRADVQPTSSGLIIGSSGVFAAALPPPLVVTHVPSNAPNSPTSGNTEAPIIIPPPIPPNIPPPILVEVPPVVVALFNDTGVPTDFITSDPELVTPVQSGNSVQYSTDGGTTWTASFDPVEGPNTVLVRQVDSAGNPGPPTTFSFVLDTIPPAAPGITVGDDIAVGVGNLASGDATNDNDLSVTVSLAGTGAQAGDTVQLYNGSGTGSPLGSSHVLTVADIAAGFVMLQTGALADGSDYNLTARITDIAGNQGAASEPFNVIIDTVDPTVTVDIEDGALNDGDASSLVTFKFSEAPVNFTDADITAVGGVVTGLIQDLIGDPTGKTYTATFTANDGLAGTGSVTVTAGGYTDAALNPGGGGFDEVAVDTNDAPTLALGGGAYELDGFLFQSYGAWTELNDGGGASGGEFTIAHDPLTPTGDLQLRLTDLDSEVGVADLLQRSIDLSGASSATLTFSYRRDIPVGDPNDQFRVFASSDGVTFTQIGQIGATGTGSFVDGAYQTFTADLTPYISANTTIRFSVGDDVDTGDVVWIDNVKIAYATGSTVPNVTMSYIENSSVGLSSQIVDADNPNMESATVVLTNKQAGDFLSIGGQPVTNGSAGTISGISYTVVDNGTSITIALTGSASKAAYQAAFDTITFANSSETPSTVTRIIQATVSDGLHLSNTANATITVTAVNDSPVIIAPTGLQYDPSSGDQTPFNRVAFADVDTAGNVTVLFDRTSGDSTFTANGAPSGGTVTLLNSSSDVQITGTTSAINAWLAGNNLTLDSDGNDTDTFTISINDGTTTTSKTGFLVSDLLPNFAGASDNNLAGVNVFEASYNAGDNDDVLYSSWNHVGSLATNYVGGAGTDTISLIFTPTQLQEILTNPTWRDDLQDFLSNPTGIGADSGVLNDGSLNLDASSWNATVSVGSAGSFETANVQLADLYSIRNAGVPSDNYVDINTTWKSVISSTEIVGADGDGNSNLIIASDSTARFGNGGNDVMVAGNGGGTLNGGAGSDLLLGGTGADSLTGATENDVLAGGAGADTFNFAELGAAHMDTVADYSFAEGDHIDLSGLLDGTAVNDGNFANYVHLLESGSDVILQVDLSGTGTFAAANNVATLVGVATPGIDPVRVHFSGQDHSLLV
jgi:hypothetical protein